MVNTARVHVGSGEHRTAAWRTAAAAVLLMLFTSITPVARAAAVMVFPGMEIRQGTTVCTLGYADPTTRIAFTAGHCHGGGVVTDRAGSVVGVATGYQNNTPDGTTVALNDVISDWETIALAPGVVVSTALPGGRQMMADRAAVPMVGLAVCHFGVVTGESCGTVDRVNNGWFTMANGVVSQKGDSGGPVYVRTADGRAILAGMFICTWSWFPAAMSWQAVTQSAAQSTNAAAVRPTATSRVTAPR
ncbi:Rv1815 family serine proteinase [Mycolicibacterium sp. CBM1]